MSNTKVIKIFNAITNVPDDLVDEAMNASNAKTLRVNTVTWQKWAGAAAAFTLIVAAALLAPKLLNNTSPPIVTEQPSKNDNPIITENPYGIVYGQNTPVREGREGTIQNCFARFFTFLEAYEEADFFAEVIITEWLGELDEEGYGETTYFRAVILDKLKNDIGFEGNEIVLLQSGNSRWTHGGYPLYKNGDRLLVPLIRINERPFALPGEDCFGIVGQQLTDMFVFEKDGKRYAMRLDAYGGYFADGIKHLLAPNASEVFAYALTQDEDLRRRNDEYNSADPIDRRKEWDDGFGGIEDKSGVLYEEWFFIFAIEDLREFVSSITD